MPPASVSAFVDALRQSRTLDAAQLDTVAKQLQPGSSDARELARDLVRKGWLTLYQANLLLQGKAGELLLGPYVLLDQLGEGGMGAVFKARHQLMKRTVALKVLRPGGLTGRAIQRFQQEIEAAAALSHPHIVTAHDAGRAGDVFYFAMEHLEGTTLADLVLKGGPLPIASACLFVRQAALGLQHAHEKGLVHRDVKPANLFLAGGGEPHVKVLDLGLARVQGGEGNSGRALTQMGAVMGTPDFMAPEQVISSRDVDIRADVYSLGCTLYFVLSGQVPFPNGSLTDKLEKHLKAEPKAVRQLRPEVPVGLEAVLRKMMAKRPQERYQTPQEVANALAPFCADKTPGAVPAASVAASSVAAETIVLQQNPTVLEPPTPAPAPEQSRYLWPGIVGALAILAAVGGLWLASRGNKVEADLGQGSNTVSGLQRQEAPEGIRVLFDGKDLAGWSNDAGQVAAWKVAEGYMEAGSGNIRTRELFGPDFNLHVEFWLPLMAEARDQARANSGVYLQGRYEIQVLDSYNNETDARASVGAVYGLLAPDKEAQNRALRPPEQWNSFDIAFHAPRVDEQGRVVEKGHISVVLNGITLINDGKFDCPTGGAINRDLGAPGPIVLQEHGSRVRYRNIWIQPLSPETEQKHP